MPKVFDRITGEEKKVRYVSNSDLVEPHREISRGERIVDDTLFESVQSVVERCERSGLLRRLVEDATTKSKYAIPPGVEVSVDIVDSIQFGTGDISDLQIQRDYLDTLEQAQRQVVPVQQAETAEVSPESSEDNEQS